MGEIEVVLKDKKGNVIRSLSFPKANAEKLIGKKSGWVLPDDSDYSYIDGRITEKKKKKPAPEQGDKKAS